MSRVRYEIAGELEALSPLHVGTGAVRIIEAMKRAPSNADPDPATPEVAELMRDASDRPFIPGTAVKGLLRRIAEASVPDKVEALFGCVKEEESGKMGAVLVRGAGEIAAGHATGMPYATLSGDLGLGVFIAARTRIARHTGVAADNALHFQEMVAPGARFRLSLLLEQRATAQPASAVAGRAETLLEALVTVLSALTDAAGLSAGKGQADGQGRLRLDPKSLTIAKSVISQDGLLEATDATAAWRKRVAVPAHTAAIEHTLILACKGPFLVGDSSHRPTLGTDGELAGPQVAAQRRRGLPLLLGSSVTGALRSRAAWLDARRRQRAGEVLQDGAEIDDPLRVFADPMAAECLRPVERLFGVAGFRGLIEIRRLDVEAGRLASFTSVRLDRFSGAPIDNALFETEAFIGTGLRLTLALTARAGAKPTAADRDLFAALIKSLLADGIILGRSGNVGFGWFTVSKAA